MIELAINYFLGKTALDKMKNTIKQKIAAATREEPPRSRWARWRERRSRHKPNFKDISWVASTMMGGEAGSTTLKSKRRRRKRRSNKSQKTQKTQNTKNTKKISKTSKTKKTRTQNKNNSITFNELKYLKKKYECSYNGSKKYIANGLWTLRGSVMKTNDIQRILPLLQKEHKKDAEKLLKRRDTNIITDYKNMWKPMPKPLNKMTRDEIIKELRSFRNAWEKITTRNMDLGKDRLAEETTSSLRSLLKWYYTNESKLLAEEWLRGGNTKSTRKLKNN